MVRRRTPRTSASSSPATASPIYHPVPDEIDWHEDTLVIGVAIDDEARSYPVQMLNRREIVNGRVGDIPILATW